MIDFGPKVSNIGGIHTLMSYRFKCSTQLLSKNERPLIHSLFLITGNNYKTIIIPNDNLNLAHPIAVAQAKPEPKDQLRVVLPSSLTSICMPKCIYNIQMYI